MPETPSLESIKEKIAELLKVIETEVASDEFEDALGNSRTLSLYLTLGRLAKNPPTSLPTERRKTRVERILEDHEY